MDTFKFNEILITRKIGSSPARVHRPTGTLLLNPDFWDTIPAPLKRFILAHEEGHWQLNTKDEVLADTYAFNRIAGTEPMSLKNSVKALIDILDYQKLGHRKRIYNILLLSLKFDYEVNKNEKALKIIEEMVANGADLIGYDNGYDDFKKGKGKLKNALKKVASAPKKAVQKVASAPKKAVQKAASAPKKAVQKAASIAKKASVAAQKQVLKTKEKSKARKEKRAVAKALKAEQRNIEAKQAEELLKVEENVTLEQEPIEQPIFSQYPADEPINESSEEIYSEEETETETEEPTEEDYDFENYDSDGYDSEGYDSEGYDAEGYDSEGFDENGYDENGYDSEGYDENGYDAEGYDADGYDSEGYDSEGFDTEGYDAEGLDTENYDAEGFSQEEVSSADGDKEPEKEKTFWQKNKKAIIGVGAAVIVAVVAYFIYKHYKEGGE